MRTFRVWWGNAGYQQDLIDAETAQDALCIATLNFGQNNLKPIRIEAVATPERKV